MLQRQKIFSLLRHPIIRRACSTQAAVCRELGERLAVEHWALPTVAGGEVKVEVVATGINFADVLQVQGQYQETLTPPFVAGMECAAFLYNEVEYVLFRPSTIYCILQGYVSDVGSDVKEDIRVGDPVICISAKGGGFARDIIVPSQSLIRLPRDLPQHLDLANAAALIVSYGTAYMGLTSRGRLQPGETVFITAAAGGVGLAAAELATHMGARVIVAAGSQEKVDFVLSRCKNASGFSYKDCDEKEFRSKLKSCAGKGGVDVMMDAVGGGYLEAGIRSLNWNGRAVVIGFAGGKIPKIPANILLVKNVEVSGLYWGASAVHDPKTFAKSCEYVVSKWVDGVITPHVSKKFPLADVNEAINFIKSRESTGKVLLTK